MFLGSDLFWTIAGVVVAVIGVLAAIRVAPGGRRLYYAMTTATPLMSAPENLRGELELRHRGVVLHDPQVIQVRLASRGRRDIPSGSFDGGHPIELRVGAPIVALLSSVSDAKFIEPPPVTIEGKTLRVGPALLGRRHTLTYSLLVDGTAPALSLHHRPINVNVRVETNQNGGIPKAIFIATISVGSAALGVVSNFFTEGGLSQAIPEIAVLMFGGAAVLIWDLVRKRRP